MKAVNLIFRIIFHFFCYISFLITNGQEKPFIQPPSLGVTVFLNDFNNFGKVEDMSPGLGFLYLKGISPRYDWLISLDASFADSAIKERARFDSKKLFIESHGAIRMKLFPQSLLFQPYLTAGIGLSNYGSYFSSFIPAGVGVQINPFRDIYIITNAQYRFSAIGKINHHLFYGIGISGSIAPNKQKRAPVKPASIVIMRAPDQDNDGIVDSLDACPLVSGVAGWNGCPIPDTDKDGISDPQDSCVTIPGIIKYNGCPAPDKDQDGIVDEEDECPDTVGTISNKGCPEIPAISKIIDSIATNIYFETGSYKLAKRSFESLDKLVSILQEQPTINLSIQGHTDNQGMPDDNQILSDNRAKSVVEYLVSKKINVSRLIAKGFGQTIPVADNNSREGRAANRRVEIKIEVKKAG